MVKSKHSVGNSNLTFKLQGKLTYRLYAILMHKGGVFVLACKHTHVLNLKGALSTFGNISLKPCVSLVSSVTIMLII